MLVGLKVADAPDGTPLALSVTVLLNPPEGVTVTPTLPAPLTVAGLAVSEKSACVEGVMVHDTEAVWVVPPLVPVTVTG
jgi:hypothetical protein